MSSRSREIEKQREYEQREVARQAEQHRRARLTMRERIEEFVQDEELKTILHKIAEQCGLEN